MPRRKMTSQNKDRPTPDQIRQAELRLDAFTTELKKDVYAAVRPVCIPDDHSRPEQIGTCVLIEIGARHFLAAAAHVFDHGTRGNLHVAADGVFVELKGSLIRSVPPTGRRRDDKFDIGFLEITGDVAANLGDVRYCTSDRLDVDDPADSSVVYAIIGYPHRLTTLDVINRKHKPALIAFTTMVDPEAFDLLKLTRGVNLPLQFVPKKMRSGGQVKRPPKVEGISGGAVMRFDNIRQPTFTRGLDKLVGIVVEHRSTPRSVILAAHIGLVTEAIVAESPELRGAVPEVTTMRLRPKRPTG